MCPLPSPCTLTQNDQRQIWWWNASKWLGNQEAVEEKKSYCILCSDITIKQHLQTFVRQKDLDICICFQTAQKSSSFNTSSQPQSFFRWQQFKKVPSLPNTAALKATTERRKIAMLLERAISHSSEQYTGAISYHNLQRCSQDVQFHTMIYKFLHLTPAEQQL